MKLARVLVFWLAALLIGCGGGGGGGGGTSGGTGSGGFGGGGIGGQTGASDITYTGLTGQASVTVDNANEIFSVVWNGGVSSGTGDVILAASLGTPEIISTGKAEPYLFSVSGASNDVRNYIKKTKGTVSSIAGGVAVNETVNGRVSGTETIVGSIDDNTGTGSLTMTYLNYNNGGATYDGVLTISVNKYDLAYQAITDMTMGYSVWTITDSSHSVTANGSVRIVDDILSNRETATFNTVIRDNNSKKTSKQENFVVVDTYNNILAPSSMTETITGRVYIEKYGYVEVSTLSPLLYSTFPQENPNGGGPIVLRGSGNATVQVTPLSTTKVRIQVDADGDGVFERTSTYYWNNLNGLPDSLPSVLYTSPSSAAADVTVNSRVTATFSAAMNASTITAATFTLKQGAVGIPGAVTYSGTTATFTPSSGLAGNTTYTVTITTGVRDMAGNPIAANYVWSFTTYGSAALFAPYAAFSTGSWPEAVAIGDVNNDGRNDVVLTTWSALDASNDYKLFVFLQNASGGLDVPVKYSTHSTFNYKAGAVAIGDINHDGKNDVVVGNAGSSIEVFLQNASGGLNSGTTYATSDSDKIKIADLNHDGLMDVAGIGRGKHSVSVWHQNASGTLDSPVAYSITQGGYGDLDLGDVNNDGLADIVFITGVIGPDVGVLTQKSDGTFNAPVYYSVGSGVFAQGVAVGDINGDNRKDVVVTYGGNYPTSKIVAFLQNGSGTLDSPISYSSYDCPGAIEIKDVNQDGRQDIVVSHGWMLGVYLQGTDGNLTSEMRFSTAGSTGNNPNGLAVGDINGDGLNDAAMADYGHGLAVLYHQ